MKIETTWDFVTKYYPDYDHCDEILDSDILQRVYDREWDESDEDDCAFRRYNDIKEEVEIMWKGADQQTIEAEIQKEIERLKAESDAYVYERAIEGYIEQLKNQE